MQIRNSGLTLNKGPSLMLRLKKRISSIRKKSTMMGFSFVLLLFTAGSVAGADCCACRDDNWARANLNATAWVQRSEEYRGLAFSAYNMAKVRLDEAIANKTWTALPEQEGKQIEHLPPAVILDVDETVLDNFTYQAWAVQQKQQWSPSTWNEWVKDTQATKVPGSRDFIEYAREKGVNFFYLTNRDYKVRDSGLVLEEYTVKNLKNEGLLPDQQFPETVLDKNGEVINNVVLMKGEKKGWGSDKTSRRSLFLKKYRIILLIGDSLGDFIGYEGAEGYEDFYKVFRAKSLKAELNKYRDRWGKSWIVLPNPTYGSWERSLYNFKDGASPGCKAAMKENSLTSWSP